MPTPTIPDGKLFFNATTYTGNGTSIGSTQTITNGAAGASFQPDLVWLKSRSNAEQHNLYDVVRGISSGGSPTLFTDATSQETTYSGYGVSALNSNGFTVIGNGGLSNNNGFTYVGWQWKAGGAAVTNTAGTISSQVSANTTSGFSVVTYTGNNTSGATVGHGLGVVPAMVICKNRTAGIGSGAWPVWHKSLTGGTYYLFLNTTAAQSNSNNNFTALPTSTVLNLGTSDTNNTATMVAYCFAEIAGYSAFGSYTGNGSTDGPFVYLGFRPKFLMIKRTDSTGDWWLEDTSRNSYNAADLVLFPNTSGAESGPSVYYWDFLSNGFKLRSTTAGYNASGGTFIYMAFAENPFKYANAR